MMLNKLIKFGKPLRLSSLTNYTQTLMSEIENIEEGRKPTREEEVNEDTPPQQDIETPLTLAASLLNQATLLLNELNKEID
jgi:hypothetical protein